VFRVPCSALWVEDYSAVGISVVGVQPDIVEDMSALIEEFEEFGEFECLKSLKSLKSLKV